ncbi:TolA protein [plant metagenome]|uniref:TolA protein n=1 Tax=plant metagenome TaxID=1297885 RepID=A0A484Q691_9ZZZZ
MSTTTELAELPPPETALQVYSKPGGLDPWLDKIRAEVSGHVPDLSTKKGRDAIASLAFKVRKVKTALDGIGKDQVDRLKEIPKKIDAERKRMREALDALADEVRAPLDQWEQAEDDRVQRHKDAIEGIVSLAADCGETVESIRAAIGAAEAVAIGPEWEEFEPEAARTKDKALTGLRDRLAAREKYDAEQAELGRLRAEAAAREQKDREERIAREAAERAQREADAKAQADREAGIRREQEAKAAAERRELELKLQAEQAERAAAQAKADKLAAEQRAEQERVAAVEREKQAAEAARQAEIKRQADAQAAEQAESKRREADKAHKAKINRTALDAFIAGGMPADCAKQAVTLIAKGAIPAVKITY